MKLGRRGFLRFLGAAPVAGPLAAKAATDAAIADLSGIKVSLGMGGTAGPGQPGTGKEYAAVSAYVKTAGLPAFAEADFRERARDVHSLDPDIANKRSWSMAVKIATQRQRNYERFVRNVHEAGWRVPARELLSKTVGWWPF